MSGVALHTRTVELTLAPSAFFKNRATEEDLTFPLEARRRAEDILVRNKSSYFFQVFSGVKHGFAVRCDLNVPHERASLSCVLASGVWFGMLADWVRWIGWAKEESARGIKEWFVRFSA